jgi:hypothetical protein
MVPSASQDEVLKYVNQNIEANYFYEKETGQFVKVPPALNTDAAREAVSSYLSIVKGQEAGKKVNEMNPRLVEKGNGVYDLFFYPKGVPEKAADNVRLETLLALRNVQKNFTPDELTRMATIRNKVIAGTATPEDLTGSEPLLSKARSLGVWSQDQQRQVDDLSVKAAQQRTLTSLETPLRTAMGKGEFNAAEAVKPKGAITAPTAAQFYASGDLSAALTTMAEGVATVAYKDPSRGTNIGIGYNMDANATTIKDDFRRAGIPPEQIDAIKAGTVHITVDQAMRLYQVVKPRYEGMAKASVDKRYPGEWEKLGDNVKAVLTDLAYQTGDVGKFSTGLEKLFAGDLSGSGFETKYRDRNTQQYVTDSRRHTLRTAMLTNSTSFQTLLSHAAKQPGNAIQSRLASVAP